MIKLVVALVLILSPGCVWSEQLLSNPGFEKREGKAASSWTGWASGYEVDEAVRRSGAASVRCSNASQTEARGASYRLILNQTKARPIIVTGWSRAENVSGVADNDYSIYVDLRYTDGSPLWGQTAPFSVGTHDWEQRRVFIMPAKPIRELSIHALFRSHSGTVWFDDFAAHELRGTDTFDFQPLAPPRPASQGEWYVRDVAAGSAVVATGLGARGGETTVRALGLHFRAQASTMQGRVQRATVTDLRGRPRAVTIYWAEAVPGSGAVRWWQDARRSEIAAADGLYGNLTRLHVGATGSQSQYPFACVSTQKGGRALGSSPRVAPRVFRLGYHGPSRLLFAAFDVALDARNISNRDARGRATADVEVVRYDTDAAWGFRSATQRYYALFPDAFQRRARAEGIWIPFTDPATVREPADFGIAYHEGDNSVESDDRLGILSFRYTEPMTYWMPMAPDVPRDYDTGVRLVREAAAGSDPEKRSWAQTVMNSGSHDRLGRFNVMFVNAPWTNGAVWVLNPNPRLPAPPGEVTKATKSWTAAIRDQLYGRSARGVLDGEYLDSIEGWAEVLDFRRESIAYAKTPPTFTPDSCETVVPTWFSVWEFAETMRSDLVQMNRLLMANGTPWRLHAFAPLLDVMGTETNWLPGGTWQADSDEVFLLRRTLCRHKPYLLLQNTDFDRFGPELVERYFQRSLFYGVYPSMFSIDAATNNYWQMPKWHDRDRHLFRKYVPLVRRLSVAGWEPITHAKASPETIFIERFGDRYLTLMNSTATPIRCTVSVDLARLFGDGRFRHYTANDLITGHTVASGPADGPVSFELEMAPGQVMALHMDRDGRGIAAKGRR